MSLRSIALLIALVGLAFPALAEEPSVIRDGEPGCDEMAIAFWMDLSPGESFEYSVDLTQCPEEKLGYFKYYGYKASKNSADFLAVRDGIVLEALDLRTGALSTSGSTSARQSEEIFVHATAPTEFLLSAENVGDSTVTVRFTWTKIIVNEGTVPDDTSAETTTSSKPKRGNGRGKR
jgi:hypothetical protein